MHNSITYCIYFKCRLLGLRQQKFMLINGNDLTDYFLCRVTADVYNVTVCLIFMSIKKN